ncbi:MAG: hypothetical protein NTV89_00555 [Proteobacteria bacterium]|nr:hypothetical protein [Pseudomonadota bacterium]
MKLSHKIKSLLYSALLLAAMTGCMKELVRVDLDTYLKNPKQYKDKHVVITATLKDVTEHYDRYKGREIEVSAPIVYSGFRSFWTWYVLMEQDGKKLHCYEEHYRLLPAPVAVDLALMARSQKGIVTARGDLLSDGIELNRLKYNGYDINTDLDIYKSRYIPIGPYW